ncbi:hypothetical protein BDZ89DRAFT_477760 [Hymenopellis radicata]|nr:hypothetical protein BDZ89DRAFT_477760 [Hymenopellis radicata]
MDFNIQDLTLDALGALSRVAPLPPTGIAGVLLPCSPLIRDVCTFEFGTMSTNDSITVEFDANGTGTTPEMLPLIPMASLPSLNQLNDLLQRALAVHSEAQHSNITFTYVAGGDMPIKLPTWTLVYWALKYQLVCSQTVWCEALASLRVFHPDLSSNLSATIVNLQWNHPLPNEFTHAGTETVQCLSRYCHANDWLYGHHMDQMISLIREDLVGRGITDVEVSLTEFFESLVAQFRRDKKKEGVPTKRSPCQTYGENLSIGATSKHIILVNIKLNPDGSVVIPETKNGIFGNHWMTVVVDGYKERIGFSDPLGYGIAPEVEACFQWWLAHFFSKPFTVEVIGGSKQEDASSCGLHSISTAHHHANPDIPLLMADRTSRYRVEWLGLILNKLIRQWT